MIRVIVADDHHLVREGLRRFLSTAADVEVLGEASTGREATALIEEHRPTVAILDINMPDHDGIRTTRELRERGLLEETSVIILSAYDDRHYVIEAIVAVHRGDDRRLRVLPPCGRCREFIRQVDPANLDTKVILGHGDVLPLRDLLPRHEWPQPLA